MNKLFLDTKNFKQSRMYIISQEIANEIARSQTMQNPLMKEWFMMTESNVEKEEAKLHDRIVKETSDSSVARAVVAYLPLFIEYEAISEYINHTGQHSLRRLLPEILSAREAALWAQRDYMMDDQQVEKTIEFIRKLYGALLEV
jgi:hypothetical protein